jgi:bifunctional NMN adenylyltransferase/nudix hydrolase
MRKPATDPFSSTSEAPISGSTAIVIGRFQLFHKGHETLLNAALATAEQVVVVIGSAFKARDSKNPFNWEERQAMVRACLSAADQARVQFLPVRDYFDDDKWNAAVAAAVQKLGLAVRGPLTLVGFEKDRTSYYLENFPAWKRLEVSQMVDVDATALRNVFFEGNDPDARLTVLAPFVSPGVLKYLQAWSRLPAYAERVREHQAVLDYKKKWGEGPFLTADAVVVVSRQVLLIRRKSEHGYGLLALPGGFINAGERFYTAALRELSEETGFRALSTTAKAALRGSQVFDHPRRSSRGRLISEAFYFNFGEMRHLPEVQGADDAMEALWVPIDQLESLMSSLFEDHYCILEHFLSSQLAE